MLFVWHIFVSIILVAWKVQKCYLRKWLGILSLTAGSVHDGTPAEDKDHHGNKFVLLLLAQSSHRGESTSDR